MQSLKQFFCIFWTYIVGFLNDIIAHLRAITEFILDALRSSWNTVCNSATSFFSSVHHFMTLIFEHTAETASGLFHRAQHFIQISQNFVVNSRIYQGLSAAFTKTFHQIGNLCSMIYQKIAASATRIASFCSKSYHKISDVVAYVYHHVASLATIAYHKVAGFVHLVASSVTHISSVAYQKMMAASTHVCNCIAGLCSSIHHRLSEVVQYIHAHISSGLQAVHTNIVQPTYTYLSHGLTTVKSGVGMAVCSIYTSAADNPLKTALIFAALLTLSVVLIRFYKARSRSRTVSTRQLLNSAIKENVPLHPARPIKVATPDPVLHVKVASRNLSEIES